MKAPQWQQRVLLVCKTGSVESLVKPAFGSETDLVHCTTFEAGILALEKGAFHAMILDEGSLADMNLVFELSQYGAQLNQRLTIIILVNKLALTEQSFLIKCGASLIMDRKAVSLERMKYVIRIMRKRTFRTVVSADLPLNQCLPVALYCFLPLNNRYAPYLPIGAPFTDELRKKLTQANSHHLYCLENELPQIIQLLGKNSITARLAYVRDEFKQLLVQLFDESTEGRPSVGKGILGLGYQIIRNLEELIKDFSTPYEAIEILPFPRWSSIAQGINSAIYSLIFSRACQLNSREEIAFAALLHNVGLCEADQSTSEIHEDDLTPEQRKSYEKHPEIALTLLRAKRIAMTPVMEQAILYHHVNQDGSGFPKLLPNQELPIPASLLAIVGCFDHLHSVKSGGRMISPLHTWELLLQYDNNSSGFKKFQPELLKQIAAIFPA